MGDRRMGDRDVTATADGGASGAESRARQAEEEPISNAWRSQSGRTNHQRRHGPRAYASEHRWLQRESPLRGRQSRERHIQLPGDWRAQSYSGRGRRDPSSRVLLQLTKVAEGNFHRGQNQYREKVTNGRGRGVRVHIAAEGFAGTFLHQRVPVNTSLGFDPFHRCAWPDPKHGNGACHRLDFMRSGLDARGRCWPTPTAGVHIPLLLPGAPPHLLRTFIVRVGTSARLYWRVARATQPASHSGFGPDRSRSVQGGLACLRCERKTRLHY